MKPVVLMILDGWGIGGTHQGNPIWQTPTPTFDWVKQNFPSFALQASGIAVGLPWGEEGNSEVGHLTIGSGRILYQHYPRITMAIKDRSFFANPGLKQAFSHAKQNQSRVHLLGLLTSAHVHASLDHLEALLQMAKNEGVSEVFLHLFTDGKDGEPREGPKLVSRILEKSKEIGAGTLASLAGRFYAMDREEHWKRTEKIYRLLTEGGESVGTFQEIFDAAYGRDLTDEFIRPTLLQYDGNTYPIKDNDALIFFNFREDSMRQLVRPFVEEEFQFFERRRPSNLFITTMTAYDENWPVTVAFPPEKITRPLAKVISDAGKRQLHLAEAERASHVTYFFNGLNPQPHPNEYWIILPSPATIKYEENAVLAAEELTGRLLQALEEKIYDFVLINYANPDLIAHTGNFEAGREVVSLMDRILNKISRACLKISAPLIVTSDHGNIENMLNPMTGRPETRHDPNPVPCYLLDKRLSRPRTKEEIAASEKEIMGGLIDIAPTVLDFMGIPKPEEMSGRSLLALAKR